MSSFGEIAPDKRDYVLGLLDQVPFAVGKAMVSTLDSDQRQRLAQLSDRDHERHPAAAVAVLAALSTGEIDALGDKLTTGRSAALHGLQFGRLEPTTLRALYGFLRTLSSSQLLHLTDGDRRDYFREHLAIAPPEGSDQDALQSALASESEQDKVRRTSIGESGSPGASPPPMQQGSAPMVQRAPVTGQSTGQLSPHTINCALPLPGPVMHGDTKLRSGRDIAIQYGLQVSPGHICDTPRRSVAFLQYKREVRIRTAAGHEALLQMEADTALFPPLDSTKSPVEHLRTPGYVSLRWSVTLRYAGSIIEPGKFDIAEELTHWHTPVGGTARIVEHNQSMAETAAQQKPFVHFFLTPQQQRKALEDFVNEAADAEVPALRKRFSEWKKKHPPMRRKKLDDSALAGMTKDQRYDLAWKEIRERSKARLKDMLDHPAETLKEFGKSALLLDTLEVFTGIGKDLTELFDSDANAWDRAAAGIEGLSKLLGWAATALFIVSWLFGIGEVVTLIAVVAFLISKAVSSFVAPELRARAASQAKTAEAFNHSVDRGAEDIAGGIVAVVMIVAAAVLHATAKSATPKSMQAKAKIFLEAFRKRLKGSVGPAPAAPPASITTPSKTTTTTNPPMLAEPPKTTTEPPKTTTEPPKTTTEPPKTTTEPPKTTTEPSTKSKVARAREDPQKGVKEALERAKQRVAEGRAEVDEHNTRVQKARQEVASLKERVKNTRRDDPSREISLKDLARANRRLEETQAQRDHQVELNQSNAERVKTLQTALDKKTYDRPPPWTETERATVWRNAQDRNGKVFSPSGREIKPGDLWIMGHKPKFEFWKHQLSAAQRAITRDQFLRECEDLSMYRPETLEDSSSHLYEDKTDAYDGL